MLTEKVKYKDKEGLPFCLGSGENSLISLLSDKNEQHAFYIRHFSFVA